MTLAVTLEAYLFAYLNIHTVYVAGPAERSSRDAVHRDGVPQWEAVDLR